jgi:hypothetical protein
MTEREAKNAAKGARAQIYLKTSHDVIRAQTSPVPVRSKIEKTAWGELAPGNAEVRHIWRLTRIRAATGIDEGLLSDRLGHEGENLAARHLRPRLRGLA